MKKWIVSACLLMVQAGAWGKITLPDIVSDNMVLQQQAISLSAFLPVRYIMWEELP